MTTQPALLDARLREALGLHQAGRLAEVGALWRDTRIPADFAEVHVNCALAQLGQNKRGEAVAGASPAARRLEEPACAFGCSTPRRAGNDDD